MGRATQAQVNRRVFAVYSWMMSGADRPTILQRSAEKWKLAERQTDEYIERAKAMIETITAADAPKVKDKHIAMRYGMMEKAMQEKGGVQTAHAILKDLDELLGSYPSAKVDVTSAGKPVKFLSITNPVQERPK